MHTPKGIFILYAAAWRDMTGGAKNASRMDAWDMQKDMALRPRIRAQNAPSTPLAGSVKRDRPIG